MRFSITYGTLNEMCAMRSVKNPGSNFIKANRIISDTPVIISGFKIGRYVRFNITVFAFFFIADIPIAANVPSIVAIIEDIAASISVFIKEEMI